ncbi:MAG: YlxR family protein [Ornithinibacter sp.]
MTIDRSGLRPEPPVRTCIGCRGTDSRSTLLRVVVGTSADGIPVLLPDPGSRRPGRGAWLHPDLSCFDLAVRRRAFGRALRSSVSLDPALVADWVRARAQVPPSEEATESGFDADEHPMSTQR